MATTLQSVGADASGVDPDPSVLATAEFRAAIADLGHPAPGSELRFEPLPAGWRLTVAVPPAVPWRVTELAVVRALDQVRVTWPDLRVTARSFMEPSSGD